MQDFQQTIIQVADSSYDEETAQTMPQQAYEFPNGYHQVCVVLFYLATNDELFLIFLIE